MPAAKCKIAKPVCVHAHPWKRGVWLRMKRQKHVFNRIAEAREFASAAGRPIRVKI